MWYKENSIFLIIDGKSLCVQLYSECAKSSNYTVIKQKKFSHLCNVIYWRFLFSVFEQTSQYISKNNSLLEENLWRSMEFE